MKTAILVLITLVTMYSSFMEYRAGESSWFYPILCSGLMWVISFCSNNIED